MGRVREESTYAYSIPGTGLGPADTVVTRQIKALVKFKFKYGNIQMSLDILFQRMVLYRPKKKSDS